jgi:hypothetical protein
MTLSATKFAKLSISVIKKVRRKSRKHFPKISAMSNSRMRKDAGATDLRSSSPDAKMMMNNENLRDPWKVA